MGANRAYLCERLRPLDAAVVSDVLDEAGFPHQVLASGIGPLSPQIKMAGFAVCASGEPRVAVSNPVPNSSPGDIEAALSEGAIAVLGTGGFTTGACIGGFVAYQFQRLGCHGVVTDGAIRDSQEIIEMGLPVYTTAVTPINGARRWSWTTVGEPLHLPGQTGPSVCVAPGDFLIGDADGVTVIPADFAEDVIAMSEELARIEGAITKALRGGSNREEAMKANPRFKHIRRLNG